jgi:hypothetical protein
MKEARILVLTNEPDYSDYQDPECNWSLSVYGDVKEIIPTDILEPKGNYVTLSHYFNANLYHDMVTGRSVTAIIHFLNQTLMDWYSKKQATVETATFGSEFIAAAKDYYRSDRRPPNDSSLSQHSYSRKELHLRRQQDRYRCLINPTCQVTQDTMLYHSIVYERQSLPSMLRSSICRANTTLPTFSASTGLMLWYGKP